MTDIDRDVLVASDAPRDCSYREGGKAACMSPTRFLLLTPDRLVAYPVCSTHRAHAVAAPADFALGGYTWRYRPTSESWPAHRYCKLRSDGTPWTCFGAGVPSEGKPCILVEQGAVWLGTRSLVLSQPRNLVQSPF